MVKRMFRKMQKLMAETGKGLGCMALHILFTDALWFLLGNFAIFMLSAIQLVYIGLINAPGARNEMEAIGAFGELLLIVSLFFTLGLLALFAWGTLRLQRKNHRLLRRSNKEGVSCNHWCFLLVPLQRARDQRSPDISALAPRQPLSRVSSRRTRERSEG